MVKNIYKINTLKTVLLNQKLYAFAILRDCQIALHGTSANLYTHQQCMRLPVSLWLHQIGNDIKFIIMLYEYSEMVFYTLLMGLFIGGGFPWETYITCLKTIYKLSDKTISLLGNLF